MNESPVVFLMGPTASGKTAVAMELVQRFDVDIISVDSAMIYIGMDIGTAKPTSSELARAPHALIDILDPARTWSVGEFCEAAQVAVRHSRAAGRVPVLTGGTMMYFRAFEQGLAELPAADEDVRQRLNALAEQHGWPALHEQLAEIDPTTATKVHPNDSQRIQRALEVYQLTGQALSDLQKAKANPLPFPIVKYAITHSDRDLLHDRIHQRFDQMMDNGFLDEVTGLFIRDDLNTDLPSIRSVGYRQLWQYLDGSVSLDEAVALAKTATRQLAKRQMTWLRSDQNLTMVSGETLKMADQISTELGK